MNRPTEAEEADRAIRRHLTAMVIMALEGSDADVARLARSEMCRLASAICTALSLHHLDPTGRCGVCAATQCLLRGRVRRALLPVSIAER